MCDVGRMYRRCSCLQPRVRVRGAQPIAVYAVWYQLQFVPTKEISRLVRSEWCGVDSIVVVVVAWVLIVSSPPTTLISQLADSARCFK